MFLAVSFTGIDHAYADVGPRWPNGYTRHCWRGRGDGIIGAAAERTLQEYIPTLSGWHIGFLWCKLRTYPRQCIYTWYECPVHGLDYFGCLKMQLFAFMTTTLVHRHRGLDRHFVPTVYFFGVLEPQFCIMTIGPWNCPFFHHLLTYISSIFFPLSSIYRSIFHPFVVTVRKTILLPLMF